MEGWGLRKSCSSLILGYPGILYPGISRDIPGYPYFVKVAPFPGPNPHPMGSRTRRPSTRRTTCPEAGAGPRRESTCTTHEDERRGAAGCRWGAGPGGAAPSSTGSRRHARTRKCRVPEAERCSRLTRRWKKGYFVARGCAPDVELELSALGWRSPLHTRLPMRPGRCLHPEWFEFAFAHHPPQ